MAEMIIDNLTAPFDPSAWVDDSREAIEELAFRLGELRAVWWTDRAETNRASYGFTDDGLPIGFQLIGKHFDEPTVLRAGDAFQKSTDWHRRYAPDAAAE